MAIRCDEVRLDAPKRTPQGGLRAPAFLTRSGVFVYQRDDGSSVRELRSADEVFHADSLASLSAAPVTRLHPAKPVDAKSFRSVVVGHVGEEVKQDGDKVAAIVYVQDAEAVAAVEAGLRQISCGYTCDIDETPGVTESGERYDRAQKNVRYNHVALVPVGRAGAEVALRLDAAGNSITGDSMPEIKSDDAVKLVEENGAIKAENARLDAELASVKAQLAELPAKMKARADLESKAATLCGVEFKCDGLTDEAVKDAMIDAALKAKESRTDATAPVAPVVISKVEIKNDERDARAQMIERNRNAWKGTAA